MRKTTLLVLVSLVFCQMSAWGQQKVGRGAAAKYFSKESDSGKPYEPPSSSGGDSFMSLMVGPYISSAAYAWKGSDKRTSVAKTDYSVTYLFDHWGSIDTNIRIGFTEYKIDDEKLMKLSLLPLWTFPMADTRFPLYFGFGAGLGVFFKQIEDESNISLDYQLVAGFRLPDLIENFGFITEFGLKNHLHILSDGQLNATSITLGGIFSF